MKTERFVTQAVCGKPLVFSWPKAVAWLRAGEKEQTLAGKHFLPLLGNEPLLPNIDLDNLLDPLHEFDPGSQRDMSTGDVVERILKPRHDRASEGASSSPSGIIQLFGNETRETGRANEKPVDHQQTKQQDLPMATWQRDTRLADLFDTILNRYQNGQIRASEKKQTGKSFGGEKKSKSNFLASGMDSRPHGSLKQFVSGKGVGLKEKGSVIAELVGSALEKKMHSTNPLPKVQKDTVVNVLNRFNPSQPMPGSDRNVNEGVGIPPVFSSPVSEQMATGGESIRDLIRVLGSCKKTRSGSGTGESFDTRGNIGADHRVVKKNNGPANYTTSSSLKKEQDSRLVGASSSHGFTVDTTPDSTGKEGGVIQKKNMNLQGLHSALLGQQTGKSVITGVEKKAGSVQVQPDAVTALPDQGIGVTRASVQFSQETMDEDRLARTMADILRRQARRRGVLLK